MKKVFVVLLSVLLATFGIQGISQADTVSEWASSAVSAGSLFDVAPTSKALGPSDEADGYCGPASWKPMISAGTPVTLTLTFPTTLFSTQQIDIYEGGLRNDISKVEVVNAITGTATTVYTHDTSDAKTGLCKTADGLDILTIRNIPAPNINKVIVTVNYDPFKSGLGTSDAAIDAVKLTGSSTASTPTPSPSKSSSASPKPSNSPTGKPKTAQAIGVTEHLLRVGKTLPLPSKTNKGLAITWISKSKTYCTVSGLKLKGVKAGACVFEGSNPGNATYAAVTATRYITIK